VPVVPEIRRRRSPEPDRDRRSSGFPEETRAAWTNAHYTTREVVDLKDGRVLVAGGEDATGMTSRLETYRLWIVMRLGAPAR